MARNRRDLQEENRRERSTLRPVSRIGIRDDEYRYEPSLPVSNQRVRPPPSRRTITLPNIIEEEEEVSRRSTPYTPRRESSLALSEVDLESYSDDSGSEAEFSEREADFDSIREAMNTLGNRNRRIETSRRGSRDDDSLPSRPVIPEAQENNTESIPEFNPEEASMFREIEDRISAQEDEEAKERKEGKIKLYEKESLGITVEEKKETEEKCENKEDLYLVDEIDANKGLVIVIQPRTNGEYTAHCFDISQLLNEAWTPDKEIYKWKDGQGAIKEEPLYKHPYLGMFIDKEGFKNSKLFNTLFIVSLGEQQVGTFLGVSRLHGATERIATLVPIHRRDYIKKYKITREDTENFFPRPEDINPYYVREWPVKRKELKEGDYYLGDLDKENKFHGRGIIVYNDGRISEGEWEHGKVFIDLKPDEKGNTILHKSTDPLEVLKLLEAGADPNIRNKEEKTPLHVIRSYEITEYLLMHGADINSRDSTGSTPIVYALVQEKDDIVDLLFEYGADLTVKDESGANLLFFAYTKEQVKRILGAGVDVNSTNKDGDTALHENDSLEVISELIEHGANINIKNNSNETPFDRAIENEKKGVIKVLLENGAEFSHYPVDSIGGLEISNYVHKELTDMLDDVHSEEFIKDLLEKKSKEELFTALREIKKNIYEFALKYRKYIFESEEEEVNFQKIKEELMALFRLYYEGWEEEYKNKIFFPHYYGGISLETILDIYKEKRILSKDERREYLSLPENINKKGKNGMTALILACKYKDIETVEELLEVGANTDLQDNDGMTALMYAVRSSFLDGVDELLKHDSNVDLQDENEKTALMHAVSNTRDSNREVMKAVITELLENDADPDTPDEDNNTPLMVAISRDEVEIVRLLLEYEADASDPKLYQMRTNPEIRRLLRRS